MSPNIHVCASVYVWVQRQTESAGGGGGVYVICGHPVLQSLTCFAPTPAVHQWHPLAALCAMSAVCVGVSVCMYVRECVVLTGVCECVRGV